MLNLFKLTPAYSATDDSIYVVRNTSSIVNKLVLFIPGGFNSPKDYSLVCQYAASLGFHKFSLAYPNNLGAAPFGTSADSLVFNKYRQEICFGTPLSNAVTVDSLNSIYKRTLNLLGYLSNAYPLNNWSRFLTNANQINCSKIVSADHSQGSGHACY